MFNLLLKTLADLTQIKILALMALPLIMAIALIAALGYGSFAFLLSNDWLWQQPWMVELNQSVAAFDDGLSHVPVVGGYLVGWVEFAFSILVGLLALFLGSYLVLLFAMLITGFMTGPLIKAVRDAHYPQVVYQGHGGMISLMAKVAGYGLIMLLVLLLTLPILLIPLLNLVWFWWLGFLFYRYVLVLDVGQTLRSVSDHKQTKRLDKWSATLALLVLYSLTLIPFVSFFAPALGVVALAHYHLQQLQTQQSSPPKT